MPGPAAAVVFPSCVLMLALLGGASCQGGAISSPSPSLLDEGFASVLATPASLAVRLPEATLKGDDQPDAYLCTSVELPADTLHVTAFQAQASSEAVTSMMLYGAHVDCCS